jgi:hypothetical protein
VVPVQSESAVTGAHPIGAHFVEFLKSGDEMIGITALGVFDAKIVDDKSEENVARRVFP